MATNAEAVDSSKTLVQGRDPRMRGPSGDPPATIAAGGVARPPNLEEASVDGSDIRASDERSSGSGALLLGRYRLIERLGAGGFGTVWHAHDEQLERAVAVKRIHLPGEEDRERAIRESRATARLSHQAIVALYEATSEDDAFYLVSELVEGDTLARLIAEDELCDEEVLEIGLSLVEALEHAHARGVIHRDVKPQNVLVPADVAEQARSSRGVAPPAAKLADFGGARLTGDDALTRTGDVFGTLAYMAPEQSDGKEAGPAADLYSLALVLYEALSGVNPVRGRTPAATARRIGSPIEPLERRRGDLPRDLTRALDAALHPDAEERGTLGDLHDALAGALERGLRRRLFARRPEARPTAGLAPGWSEDPEDAPQTADRRRLELPRAAWLGCALAVATWQAFEGRAGISLLVLAAAAPLAALPRRSGLGWLAAALAPVLGLAGLAGAFPALAGQRTGWRARASLAILGFWWLALADSLFPGRLWLGAPAGTPARGLWEGSFTMAATHVVGPILTLELLLGAVVWTLAGAVLPWIVRGRNAALDVGAAVVWTVGLLAAVPLLERSLLGHANPPSPHGALFGAVLGCALAIGARALRGPV